MARNLFVFLYLNIAMPRTDSYKNVILLNYLTKNLIFVLQMFSWGMDRKIRNFPAPWKVRRTAGGYAIDCADKISVAYVYFVDGFRTGLEGRALTADEAWRIANDIARLPDLLAKPKS